MINNKLAILCAAFLVPSVVVAQTPKTIGLKEAVEMGIANSKNLKLAQHKIEELNAQMATVKDNALPTASASLMFNHAEIPLNKLDFGTGNPFTLPQRADAWIGTASVKELVYGGGKLKLARENTKLLTDVAQLDVEKNKEEVAFAVISTYYSLYKLAQSKKVVAQNLESIAGQLKQAQSFYSQGVVTKNDVLRFQLQQANVSLNQMELESNRKVINYNLDILLGLPDGTDVAVVENDMSLENLQPLTTYLDMAYTNRQELKQLDVRNKVADNNIKNIQADLLPTLGVGADLYYINPTGNFIPKANTAIMPIALAGSLSWNFGKLWTNKNKVSEARVQQQEIGIQKEILTDNVKNEVNKSYQNYNLALQKIQVLQTSIAQATENDRLLASKYKNNIASVTDRIDAETLLYQAKINLELAKADAGLAYYNLLKSTGKISQ